MKYAIEAGKMPAKLESFFKEDPSHYSVWYIKFNEKDVNDKWGYLRTDSLPSKMSKTCRHGSLFYTDSENVFLLMRKSIPLAIGSCDKDGIIRQLQSRKNQQKTSGANYRNKVRWEKLLVAVMCNFIFEELDLLHAQLQLAIANKYWRKPSYSNDTKMINEFNSRLFFRYDLTGKRMGFKPHSTTTLLLAKETWLQKAWSY